MGELAIIEQANYPILSADSEEMMEAFRENFEDEQLDPFILERVKLPAGGGTVWELEDSDPVKNLDAIIVGKKGKTRAYWVTSLEDSGGGSPPDCSSDDGVTGRFIAEDSEVEIRKCKTCPFNQFGSDPKGGRGKACKETMMLALLREGQVLPMILVVPPTSLRPVRDYMRRLTSKGLPYWSVVSRFTLVQDKNASGIKYSKIQCDMVGVLDAEAKAKVKAYVDAFKPVLNQVQIDQEDIG